MATQPNTATKPVSTEKKSYTQKMLESNAAPSKLRKLVNFLSPAGSAHTQIAKHQLAQQAKTAQAKVTTPAKHVDKLHDAANHIASIKH